MVVFYLFVENFIFCTAICAFNKKSQFETCINTYDIIVFVFIDNNWWKYLNVKPLYPIIITPIYGAFDFPKKILLDSSNICQLIGSSCVDIFLLLFPPNTYYYACFASKIYLQIYYFKIFSWNRTDTKTDKDNVELLWSVYTAH